MSVMKHCDTFTYSNTFIRIGFCKAPHIFDLQKRTFFLCIHF